jgi:8-oxo-dGTP pyrophosphatase MutT (NUDIX family)
MRQRATALIIRGKKILLVRESGYCYTPGGGIEEGETPLEAITRECGEEIGCPLVSAREYFTYDSINVFSSSPQRNYCYFVDIDGDPQAKTGEIDDALWLSWEELSVLSDVIPYERKMIFDRLREEGVL